MTLLGAALDDACTGVPNCFVQQPAATDPTMAAGPTIFVAIVVVAILVVVVSIIVAIRRYRRATASSGVDPLALEWALHEAKREARAEGADVPEPSTPSAPSTKSIAERLASLDSLRESGAITQEEHDAGRARILGEI